MSSTTEQSKSTEWKQVPTLETLPHLTTIGSTAEGLTSLSPYKSAEPNELLEAQPDYSSRKWAFRDPNKLISVFLAPNTPTDFCWSLTHTIGNNPTPKNTELLLEAIHDESRPLINRYQAYSAYICSENTRLSNCPSELVNSALSLIVDKTLSTDIRQMAVNALRGFGTKESMAATKKLITDSSLPNSLRIEACRAFGYEARKQLKEFAFNTSLPETDRISALEALAPLKDKTAITEYQTIAKQEKDDNLRLAAVRCGLRIEPQQFLDCAFSLATAVSPSVKEEVLDNLRKYAPRDLIAHMGVILKDDKAMFFEKLKAFYALAGSKHESGAVSARNFLVTTLGENGANEFIDSLPPKSKCLFTPRENTENKINQNSIDLDQRLIKPDSLLDTFQKPKGPMTLQEARSMLTEFIDGDLSTTQSAISILKSSTDEKDKSLLTNIAKNTNLIGEVRMAALAALPNCGVEEIENLMLTTLQPTIAVDAAKVLHIVNPSKGQAAFKELLKDHATSLDAIETCCRIGDSQLMDLLSQRAWLLSQEQSRNHIPSELLSIDSNLSMFNRRAEFISAVTRMAANEKDPKYKASLRDWISALSNASTIGIDHPLRMFPETLSEVVRNRLQSPVEREKDPRPTAIIVMAKSDNGGFSYATRQGLKQLTDKGYRLMFYEANSRNQIITAGKEGAPPNGAKLIVLIAHGNRDAMAFGDSTEENPLIDARNGVTLSDCKDLIKEGFGNCLAKDGRIVLLSCSTGADAESTDNIANMFRKIAPQAIPKGIIAPRIPTDFRRFIFNEEGEVIDFEGISERYQAMVNQSTNRRAA